MINIKYFLYIIAVSLCSSHLYAEQEIQIKDKDQYESLTGLKGTYNEIENVFKASFPRNDVKISIDNIQGDPFMGLTS